MKPACFDYYDPATLGEALDLLARLGPEAKLVAGGQSLVPVLNMRLATPKALIDLRRVKDLRYIRTEGQHLCIGAMTPHAEVEGSDLVAARSPLLHEAVGFIGHTAIRNRGTIGGSLAHADPAAELPTVALALDAEIVVVGPTGARRIPAGEFFAGYFTTSMAPDEVLTEVRLPMLPAGAGTAFAEIARRHGDFALVGVGCYVTVAETGRIDRAGIALCGVGPTPVRISVAEERLRGELPTDLAFAAAGQATAGAIEPESDIHGDAGYRRQLAAILVRRALQTAFGRAGSAVDRR